MEEQNEAFKEAIRDANLPEIDYDKDYQRLQEAVRIPVSHTWRQQGPALVCFSCPYQHSQYIGMDKILVGFDKEGAPILEKR